MTAEIKLKLIEKWSFTISEKKKLIFDSLELLKYVIALRNSAYSEIDDNLYSANRETARGQREESQRFVCITINNILLRQWGVRAKDIGYYLGGNRIDFFLSVIFSHNRQKGLPVDVFQIYFWECMPTQVFYNYTDYLS